MVSEYLTTGLIEEGENLLAQLERDGVALDAAVWVFDEERGYWRLVLAVPGVEASGPRNAYHLVLKSFDKIDTRELTEDAITVDRQQADVARLLSKVFTVKTSSPGVRFSRGAVNGAYVDDAYIYPVN